MNIFNNLNKSVIIYNSLKQCGVMWLLFMCFWSDEDEDDNVNGGRLLLR